MTGQELRVLTARTRKLYIKLNVLNPSLNMVGCITGLMTGGSYSIDRTSSVRRTCSVVFRPHSSISLSSATSMLAANRRFALFVGLTDTKTGEVVWFNEGIYCIDNPSRNITSINDEITVSGLDLTSLLDGTLGGNLGVNTKVVNGTNISTVIRSTMSQLGSESRLSIVSSSYTVPYDIEKGASDTVWDLISDITALYMRYESYYDENGYFVFTDTKVTASDTVSFDFDAYSELVLGITHNVNYENIRNKITVWGKVLNSGTQYSKVVEVRNSNYPDCPYTIEKMGETSPRAFAVEENYYTQTQVDDRASYEVEQHTNCAETVTITCMPIYGLSVNRLIYLNYPEKDVVGKWCVDTVSCDLSIGGTMSITAHKVYS